MARGAMINQWDYTPASPAACVFDGELYVVWMGGDRRIYFSASASG
jgi:hypothetical protein